MIDSECYLWATDDRGQPIFIDFTDRPPPLYSELFKENAMANEPKGMKKAMRGKGAGPKMTAGAAGGLGRIQKSDAAGGKGEHENQMMTNDRGRGGTGPRKEGKTVERYGISPQLAPPRNTPMTKECLNSEIVSRPQATFGKRMK